MRFPCRQRWPQRAETIYPSKGTLNMKLTEREQAEWQRLYEQARAQQRADLMHGTGRNDSGERALVQHRGTFRNQRPLVKR